MGVLVGQFQGGREEEGTGGSDPLSLPVNFTPSLVRGGGDLFREKNKILLGIWRFCLESGHSGNFRGK